MRGTLAVLAAVSIAACGKPGSKPEPLNKRRVFVPDAELEAMKAEHARALERNRALECNRPVLRGDALDGPADEHILALPKRLDVCLGALSYRLDAVEAALFYSPDEAPVDEDEHRIKPLDEDESKLETIAQLEAACDELLPALHDAVSHRNACSPYVPGRSPGATPGELLWYPRLALPLLVRARLFARSGRPVGAARMLLDYLRLGQDLYRGGTSILVPMVATSGMRQVIDQLQQLIRTELDADGLAAIAGELAILEASEPGLPALFANLPVDYGANEVLPHLAGRLQPNTTPAPPDLSAEDHEVSLVLLWIALRRTADTLSSSCPAGATDRACVTAYQTLMAKRARAPRELDRDALLQTELTRVGPELRGQIVDVLEAELLEGNWSFVARIAWRRAALVALRWHAEARAAFARKQPCRAPDDLGMSTLGETLEVDDAKDYLITLRAPAWTDSGLERPTRYLLSVNCALAPPKPK